MKILATIGIATSAFLLVSVGEQAVLAKSHDRSGGTTGGQIISPGLTMPAMDSARGGELFASKGCVVCHSVNGVGGEDAPALDADTMPTPMNPFEFAAKMWRGAEAMVYLQREELGEQIELDGEELESIIAFVHDAREQKRFSEADIPPRIERLMHHMEEGDEHHDDAESHDEDRE